MYKYITLESTLADSLGLPVNTTVVASVDMT